MAIVPDTLAAVTSGQTQSDWLILAGVEVSALGAGAAALWRRGRSAPPLH